MTKHVDNAFYPLECSLPVTQEFR